MNAWWADSIIVTEAVNQRTFGAQSGILCPWASAWLGLCGGILAWLDDNSRSASTMLPSGRLCAIRPLPFPLRFRLSLFGTKAHCP